jgi:hypothetical protein
VQDFDAETNAVDGVVDSQGAGALGAGGDDALGAGFADEGGVQRGQSPEALGVPFP